jgi:hypothetical protein
MAEEAVILALFSFFRAASRRKDARAFNSGGFRGRVSVARGARTGKE